MSWLDVGMALAAPFLGGFLGAAAADLQGWLNRRFMPGCTHAGVARGTTCPLCGRTV